MQASLSKTTKLILVSFLCGLTLACGLISSFSQPGPTHIAEPPRIATTPTPQGGELGGLDGVFAATSPNANYKDYHCYRIFRLFPDGMVLFHDAMCVDTDVPDEIWPKIKQSFDKGTLTVSHGEYYHLGDQIWMLIIYDYHFRTAYRDFRGTLTEDGLALVELNLYFESKPPLTVTPTDYIRLNTGE